MSTPIGGRRRVYSSFERKVIDPYKETYMNATTPGQRKNIAIAKIFPQLFTYWSEMGVVLTKEEEDRRSDVSNKKYL
jgi:hypothetical protein